MKKIMYAVAVAVVTAFPVFADGTLLGNDSGWYKLLPKIGRAHV